MQRTRERTGTVQGSEVEQAPSVAEVKEAILRQAALPAGATRLILHITPDQRVETESVPIGDVRVAPAHPETTLVFELVGVDGKKALIIARKSKLYDDLNTAVNHILGTADNPVQYIIRFIPVSMYDPETGQDNSRGTRVYPPTGSYRDSFERSIMRGSAEDQDINQQIIPLEVERPGREASSRTAAVLHPLASRPLPVHIPMGQLRRDIIAEAGVKAQKELSAMYDAEMKAYQLKHPPKETTRTPEQKAQDEAKLNQIATALNPLLEAMVAAEQEDIPEDVLLSVGDFIAETLSQSGYHRLLRRWARTQLERYPPNLVWPVIRWLIDESNRAEELRVFASSSSGEEPVLDEADIAFEIHPAEECEKWRVIKRALTDEEAKQQWVCCSEAGGGMDVRGMPPRVQDLTQELAQIRERLRFKRLPHEEKQRLQTRQQQICTAMHKIPEEDTDQAMARLSDFAGRVVDNPIWARAMKKIDEEVKERERVEHSLRDIVAAFPEEGPEASELEEEYEELPETEQKISETERAALERLTHGIGTSEDRALLENTKVGATEFVGGSVRDDIDFLEDIIEARAAEIEDVSAHLHELEYLEREIQESQKLSQDLASDYEGETPERQQEIQGQLTAEDANRRKIQEELEEKSKKKPQWADELKRLLDEQNQDQIRLEHLRTSKERDPMIPGLVAQGEQNEVFVLQAINQIMRDPAYGFVLHHGRDVTPVANQLKIGASDKSLGRNAKDVVFAVLDPDKYNFLGAKKSPIGSATVWLGKGLFVPRAKIRTQQDVDAAAEDFRKKSKDKDPRVYEAVRQQLQTALEENQILPYILGGAFLTLAEQETKQPGVTPPELSLLIQNKWHIPESEANRVISQWQSHVQNVMQQSARNNTRQGAVKTILSRAKVMEAMRVSGVVPRGSRVPWWDFRFLDFPVRPPPASASSSSSAKPPSIAKPSSPLTGKRKTPSPSPANVSTSSGAAAIASIVQELAGAPSERDEAEDAMAALIGAPVPPPSAKPLPVKRPSAKPVKPPVVVKKRKEKTTRPLSAVREEPEEVKESAEKRHKPAVEEAVPMELDRVPCDPQDIALLREVARDQRLFIATQEEGLKKLCANTFDPVTRTGNGIRFLQNWRKVIDAVKQRLVLEGIDVTLVADEHFQKVVLNVGFQTAEKRERIFQTLVAELRGALPPAAASAAAPPPSQYPVPFQNSLAVIQKWAADKPALRNDVAKLFALYQEANGSLAQLSQLIKRYPS